MGTVELAVAGEPKATYSFKKITSRKRPETVARDQPEWLSLRRKSVHVQTISLLLQEKVAKGRRLGHLFAK